MMSNGNAGRPLELYVHVPFCVRKCLYCDFYSHPGTDAEEKAFFEHLFREVRETPFSGEVRSVFIGGGTPSVADPSRIRETLSVLRAQFPFRADAEISMEANPGTVTEEKLSVYRDAGINRLSIGMQSADDGMLASIGRIHRFSDVAETVKQARAAGFRNLNLDLISGLPGETAESFENTLFQALSLEPEHLSVYSLTLAENTPFYALYGEGAALPPGIRPLPDEETGLRMTRLANRILEKAGFRHYEVSNYARPGYECLHNMGYWTGTEYLGFGPSAASYIDGKRFRNADAMDWYDRPYEETETLSSEDRMAEYMILGLRTADGVREAGFRARFGSSMEARYGQVLAPYVRVGAVRRVEDGYALSEEGINISNRIFRDLL